MPTQACSTGEPVIRSTFSKQLEIAETASSILVTTPLWMPSEGASAKPITCGFSPAFAWATATRIAVEPMSKPAMIGEEAMVEANLIQVYNCYKYITADAGCEDSGTE